jgi:predicted dehydrogenase
MNSIPVLNAAVVGGGAFGECHLKTWSAMPQISVAGLYTLERERGEMLCRQYGGINYSSLEELAADPSIDVVSMATPEDAHLESFRVLAEAGKAVYVEKPLATSLTDAGEILDLSRSIIAMSGHCLRFESRMAQVFSRRDRLGRLRHMSFRSKRRRSEKFVYGRVHPAWVLLCHEIELSNSLAQERFKRVCAVESRFSDGQIDFMSMLIEYHNGVTSSIEGGWAMPTQESVAENDHYSLDFEHGTFEVALPHTGFTLLDSGGLQCINHQFEFGVYGMEFGALRSAFEYMARCVQDQVPPAISTVEDGYEAVRLIEAALQSAATGQWVHGEPS